MKPLHWFRVELTAEGKLVSCVLAEGIRDGSVSVHFIRAHSSSAATECAYLEHNANLLRARRARLAAEGRCRCGREMDAESPLKRCRVCRTKSVADEQRVRIRSKGINVPKPDRRAALAERRDEDRDAIRRATLAEVRAAWISARTNELFTKWLTAEIAKLAVRQVA